MPPHPLLLHRQCRSLNILHAHFLWYSIGATSCFYKTLTSAGPLDVKSTPPSGTQHPQNNIVLKHRLGLPAEIKRCGRRLQGPRFRVSTVTSNQADTPASTAWGSLDYGTLNAEAISAHSLSRGGHCKPALVIIDSF